MKTNFKQRGIALGTLGVLMATTLSGAITTPAHATKTKSWKTAAIVGGVVTGYGLIKKKKTATIAGAAVTAYSYSRYRNDKKKDDRTREAARIRWYKNRYGSNWRTHYVRGG